MTPWIKKYIGKRRIKDMATKSGKMLAQELTINTTIFYGEKEAKQFPQLKKRCEETARLARNAKLIVVKDSPHDIAHPNYVKKIESVIR
jgi:hypothetical protein